VGFLLIFAVELTVGARFLADLVPEVPRWITVCVLSFVGFLYTSQGGFRAVIRTDQIQMRFIWLFIVAVLLFIGFYVWGHPHSFSLIPRDLYSFGYQPGLGAFIFGVTVMNVPTHISNMSIWQRIAGANDPKTVVRGLWKSTFSSAISWTALVLIALLTFTVSVPETGQNLLVVFLRDISAMPGGRITVFFVAMGLYGAMLSTASTQLIVVSHTVSEDILAPSRRLALADRVSRKGELAYSRRILFLSAVLAVGFVELLNLIGFSIADLVFSIYGGQLVLFPIIMLALFKDRSRLGAYRVAANWAIVFGFMAGWGAALVGNFWHIPYLVFLSPALSIGSSSLVLFVGRFLPWLLGRK
jgi:Na+/proline symporter